MSHFYPSMHRNDDNIRNDDAIHNSYRIDDIEDNSCLRRGVPVAHSIYGVASTINAANYVFFLALEKVQQLGHPDVSIAFRWKINQSLHSSN